MTYKLQTVVGIKNPRTKFLDASKNTPFTPTEMRSMAHQYALDNQLNPDTVGINQFENDQLMPGFVNHYLSAAKENSMTATEQAKRKKQIEIEIGKGAKVGNINVKESILASLQEGINLQKLNGASAKDVCNAFIANYVTSLLLLKLQDIKGLMLINDHGHSKLTKFSATMSDLNFWGRAMFYSNDADVKSRMKSVDEAKILTKAASKVSTSRIQKIMHVPLTSPDVVDWNDAIGAILLLQHTFNIQSSYFGSIVRTLHKWDSVNVGAKQKAINDALMFMMQSDPSSMVIPHLRKLSNLIMTQKIGNVAQRIINFKKLNETDGGGAVSTSAIASSSNAIVTPNSANATNSQTGHPDTSQDIQNVLGGLYRLKKMAPNQITKKGRFTIRNGKLIVKRVKSFSPSRFKEPEFLKPIKDTKENQDVA
jgi:hypothetical protein